MCRAYSEWFYEQQEKTALLLCTRLVGKEKAARSSKNACIQSVFGERCAYVRVISIFPKAILRVHSVRSPHNDDGRR